ncbi:MAG: trypsin-like serine protease [Myxococcota bacterium]
MKKTAFVALVAATLAACASEGESATAVIDNGDRTWSRALPADFDPSALRDDGLVVWQYAGQARYSHDPQPMTGPLTYLYDGDEPEDLVDQMLSGTREDALGRMWVPVDVREEDLVRYDHEVDVPPLEPTSFDVPPIGTPMTWYPNSWTKTDCLDADPDIDIRAWNGDDRRTLDFGNTVYNSREKALVEIDASTGGSCTGTLMRNRWVLTANHCTFDDNGNPVSSYTIYNYDRSESRQQASIQRGPSFNANATLDANDDYALIELASSFVDAETMDWGSPSNSKIDGVGANFHNLGVPRYLAGCELNIWSFRTHDDSAEVTGKNTRNLRWKGDGGAGHSGGPLYYCPQGADDVCTTGDTPKVVAVWAGWSGYYNRHIGPRTSYFRSWAVNLMNSQ